MILYGYFGFKPNSSADPTVNKSDRVLTRH